MYEIFDYNKKKIEDSSTLSDISSYSKNSYCFFIGAKNLSRHTFKYMDLETAMRCIKGKTIRFAQPDTWPDKYEGRFYNADYKNVTNNYNNTPKLYACCVTFTKVSEAAWKTYTYNKKGFGSRCVQFRFDKSKFRNELYKFAKSNKQSKYKVYEGDVSYAISDFQIDSLHQKSSPFYAQYFYDFKLDKYLKLLLIKRPAFKYEEEFRFFMIPDNQNIENSHIDVPISWPTIIDEILIDEDCSDVEIEAFKAFCKKYGIDEHKISKLDLHTNPQPNIVIE